MDFFIARDRSGNFYLDDNRLPLRCVHKFSSTGSDLGLIGAGDFPDSHYAEGMAFDSEGNLLVVDTVANVVRKFSPTGAYLGLFASTGLDAPRDIILNSNGNLLVTNSGDRTISGESAIREFSPSGADLGNFAVTGLNHPYGMALRPTPATPGQTYSYLLKAIDPDNDSLTYSLTTMPDGMTIDPTAGQISWNPQASDVGAHNVTVRVEDGRGGFDTQSFVIDVLDEPPAPQVDLTVEAVNRTGLSVDPQTLAAAGTVSATVKNLGPNPVTQPFDVLFFEDVNHNSAYDAGTDAVLGQATVSSPLGAGATVEVSTAVAAQVSFPGIFVWAFVDSGNAVAESNEANNLARNEVHCQFVPQPGVFDPVMEWSWTSSQLSRIC